MWCFDVRHDGQSWSCRTVVASECRCMLVCQTFICHRERLFLLSHEIFRNLTNWHFLSRCKTNARCKPRVRPLYWRMCRVDGLAVCLRGGNRRVPACTSNLQKSKNSHCLAKAALGGSSDGRGGGRRPNKQGKAAWCLRSGGHQSSSEITGHTCISSGMSKPSNVFLDEMIISHL